jgi:hypothetical protein
MAGHQDCGAQPMGLGVTRNPELGWDDIEPEPEPRPDRQRSSCAILMTPSTGRS